MICGGAEAGSHTIVGSWFCGGADARRNDDLPRAALIAIAMALLWAGSGILLGHAKSRRSDLKLSATACDASDRTS